MSFTRQPDYLLRRQQREQEQKERETFEKERREREGAVRALNSLANEIRGAPTEKSRSDKRLVTATWIGAIAAVLAALLSGGNLVAFWLLTTKADATARETLHQSQRPWISASDARIAEDYGSPAARSYRFLLSITLRNTGSSIATRAAALAIPVNGDPDKMRKLWPKVCDSPDSWSRDAGKPNANYMKGMVIAPGQALDFRESTGVDDIGPDDGYWIFGCVTYVDQFKINHHTRFCFQRWPQVAGPIAFKDCAQAEEAD